MRLRSLTYALSLLMVAAIALVAARPASAVSDEEVQKMKDAMPAKATAQAAKAHKILIFTRCEGFVHSSVPYAAKAIELMGDKTKAYTVEVSDKMEMFEPEKLNEFDAVVFDNTTSLKFENEKYRKALVDFVNSGKGVVGIHAAVDNFNTWAEGAAIMGAVFDGHPWGTAPVKIDDPKNPLTKVFDGKGFWINDEMYKMKEPYSREKQRVLLSFDMSKLPADAPTRADKDNPIAWIHEVGKGRVFYCSLGHNHEIFWNKPILQFYLDGIQYALGDLKADATPSAKLNPQPAAALAPEKK